MKGVTTITEGVTTITKGVTTIMEGVATSRTLRRTVKLKINYLYIRAFLLPIALVTFNMMRSIRYNKMTMAGKCICKLLSLSRSAT